MGQFSRKPLRAPGRGRVTVNPVTELVIQRVRTTDDLAMYFRGVE
jgi:hypothetical protein